MKNFEILRHFGVYGVAFKRGKLLVINKISGPYQNRYDLPGGSQEMGESLQETLTREVLEETGFTVLEAENQRIYSAWVCENDQKIVVHHIFNLYDVELGHYQQELPEFVVDGKNDSDSALWLSVAELSEENASPLVLKVLDELKNCPDIEKARIYKNWKVKK